MRTYAPRAASRSHVRREVLAKWGAHTPSVDVAFGDGVIALPSDQTLGRPAAHSAPRLSRRLPPIARTASSGSGSRCGRGRSRSDPRRRSGRTACMRAGTERRRLQRGRCLRRRAKRAASSTPIPGHASRRNQNAECQLLRGASAQLKRQCPRHVGASRGALGNARRLPSTIEGVEGCAYRAA